MHLRSVDVARSPEFRGFTRITAQIARNRLPSIEIWFEVEDHLSKDITQSSTPWIIAMLPYAMESGDIIETDIPSDAYFVENMRGIAATWKQWYPWLKSTEIRCPITADGDYNAAGRRTAAFFSSGVDSWFSILRHCPDRDSSAVGRIDDLMSVHGLDIPLDKADAFEALRSQLQRGADLVNKELIILRTNLRRQNSLWARGWGWLTHGAGLSAIGHLLDRRLSRVIIGSTHPHGHLIPWGSHPMTDPMFSSSHLSVTHDGAVFNRVDKTRLLARHPEALALLHICWKHGNERNCGKCAKCIRTMATLNLLGVERADDIFDEPFCLSKLSANFVSDENEDEFMTEVKVLAESVENPDMLEALDHSLTVSRRIRPLINAITRMRHWPYVWRFEVPLRKLLLRAL